MSWYRCMTIASKADEEKMITSLTENFRVKKIMEHSEYILIAYEGREIAEFDCNTTLSYGIDDRNCGFFVSGNQALVEYFSPTIELTVGISLNYTQKINLKSRVGEIFRELKNNVNSDSEEEQDNGRYSIRIAGQHYQVVPAINLINELSNILEEDSIPYYAAVFEENYGQVRGDLGEPDLYIGPNVSIVSYMASPDIELILNTSETLVDGNSVKEFKNPMPTEEDENVRNGVAGNPNTPASALEKP
jgi:hypothetical protein